MTESLAAAGATLVLAAGTFASVRPANRAARTAERALLAGLRPVQVPSRLEDPADKIMWADNHWARLWRRQGLHRAGRQAAVRDADDGFYPGVVAALKERRRFVIELRYSDHEGGAEPDQWLCSVGRHWSLDRPDPR